MFLGSEFGDVPNKFVMDNVNCRGSEKALWDCKHFKYNNCGVKEGAGVVCSDPISKCIFRSITTA